MKEHRIITRTLVLFAVAVLLLTACGAAIHIPEVSAADKQARMDELGAYLNAPGSVSGDASKGENSFAQMCEECHGEDGREQNFGEDASPEYVGSSAINDPGAVFEIINFGDGERKMPGFYDDLSLEQLINILAYAQTLPNK